MIKLSTFLLILISCTSSAQYVYIDKKLEKPVFIKNGYSYIPTSEYFPVKVSDLDTLFANISYLKKQMKPVQRAKLQSYKLYSGCTIIIVTTVSHSYADAFDVMLVTSEGDAKAEYLVGNNKDLNAKSIKHLSTFTNLIQNNADIKIRELNNYEPMIREPEALIINPEYKPGCIIYEGSEEKGFILFEYDNGKEFRFRKNRTDKKQKITVQDCQGFKVDGKVFRVILLKDEYVFAESVVEGKMNLYKAYVAMPGNYSPGIMSSNGTMIGGAFSMPSTVTYYVLETQDSREFIKVDNKKKHFRHQMELIFKDRPDIVSKVKDGTYGLKNIEALVREYNQ